MAELLIKATGHWMDKLTQAEVDKMTPEQKASYEARCQKGDIVAVFPDGKLSEYATANGTYVIVKIPEMSVEEAKKFEEPLVDKDGKMIRYRKNALPVVDVKDATLSKTAITSKVILKTGLSTEILSPVVAKEI